MTKAEARPSDWRTGEPAAGGDAPLGRLLRDAGAAMDASAVRDLVRGVIAAPEQFEPDAWMELVAEDADGALKEALGALYAADDAARRGAPGVEARTPRGPRLEALRGELRRRRLHGFIVPRNDEHQVEFVPGRAGRLAWLTGFTGSAGLAVVLREQAAVFVDGRYTLQAGAEIDGALFSCRHLTEEPPSDWIANTARAKWRIGYDPWLHSPAGVERLKAACGRAGARLVACEENPVDAVWPDQPPPPIAPVVPHDRLFAGQDSAEKRREIAEFLAREGADAALLNAPDSIAWLLNLRGGDVPYAPLFLAFAIIHSDATVDLFVDRRKLTSGTRAHLGNAVRLAQPEALGPALDRLGGGRKSLRLDAESAPAWAADRAKAAGARLLPGADPCQLPKARKNAVELAGMRACHGRDGAALTRFLRWLPGAAADGLSEIAAAERLEGLRREDERFRGLSFPTISGAGAHGAIVHYRVSAATDGKLQPGTLYLVDSGAQYLDGTTDVTRTVAIGTPDAEMRDRFTRVLKGHIAIATARFPVGTTGPQLDILARRALWEAGLDYDHGTGHGVGSYLGVHEGPQRIAKLPHRTALEPGMIVSNEPGYYKAGAYGIRIENLVAVTEIEAPTGAERAMLGFETLTLAPIDLALVEPALMTAAEIAWLDAYHARVCAALSPMFDAAAAEWLAGATRALD